MNMKSDFDGLLLETAVVEPEGAPKGIIAFSHGMAEHKERYFDFMKYLASAGYLCVIHDHRGHGGSVKSSADYGYFYTEDIQGIVGDLHQVISSVKKEHPELPVYLFSHSMGTLVARCYLKQYDGEIDKVVLCGPPTENKMAGMGLALAKGMKPFMGKNTPNLLLNMMAFGPFVKKFPKSESWLSVCQENARAYAEDPLCGFFFTTNGFINLMKLQLGAYEETGWKLEHPELPILLIAGEEDPVIQSKELFSQLATFLRERGYRNVYKKLYTGLRHEILNEKEHLQIYEDVLNFFENE
ncbi:MAG: alpha/beta hydrolase [Lachnospiraceae bacterium]|nr:alpha/beta hydrolase [Lachnospiraceae bacterium]